MADRAWDRVVLHVDMDAFFASVEQLDDPSLRGKPVLVGGTGPRGVVTAASYEARPFGCRSAMPMAVARRLCPQALVVGGRFDRYRQVSALVFEVLGTFTPVLQPVSIDEAFLDVTGSQRLHGDGPAMARAVRRSVRDVTGGLTASVGVASNKFLAKLASDLDKPDGMAVIEPWRVDAVLAPLGVERLPGVGPVAVKRLGREGIRTVGALRELGRAELERLFGSSWSWVWRMARGLDDRSVETDHGARSISHEQTFGEDLCLAEEARQVLLRQTESVARRVRKHGRLASVITVKIRDGGFVTVTRRCTLASPTDRTADLWSAAAGAFDRWARSEFRPIRLLGVGASGFRGEAQLGLFTAGSDAQRSAADAAEDRVVARFGRDAIRRAGTLGAPGRGVWEGATGDGGAGEGTDGA